MYSSVTDACMCVCVTVCAYVSSCVCQCVCVSAWLMRVCVCKCVCACGFVYVCAYGLVYVSVYVSKTDADTTDCSLCLFLDPTPIHSDKRKKEWKTVAVWGVPHLEEVADLENSHGRFQHEIFITAHAAYVRGNIEEQHARMCVCVCVCIYIWQ